VFSSFRSRDVYQDTVLNRIFDRVGRPLSAPIENSASFVKHSYTELYSKPRSYVDNLCNRWLDRVGQPVGLPRPDSFGREVLNVVKMLEAESHKDLAVAEDAVALEAAGIIARETFWDRRRKYRGRLKWLLRNVLSFGQPVSAFENEPGDIRENLSFFGRGNL
jgi:hypothetical protein